MPKGLAFLSKKSFHTSKLCNQEKVWIAEQEAEAEDVKMRELARQIKQEREEEELDRISGRRVKRMDRGIDWMYQGNVASGNADDKPNAFEEEIKKKEHEDYLLGKEYNPSNAKRGDLASAVESSAGVNTVLVHLAESAPHMEKRSDAVDWSSNFQLRHEDPMFFVEQQRRDNQIEGEKKQILMKKMEREDFSSTPAHHNPEKKRKNRRREKSRHNERDSRGRRKRHKTKKRDKSRHRRSQSSERSDDRTDKKRDKSRHHRPRSSESDDRRDRIHETSRKCKQPPHFKSRSPSSNSKIASGFDTSTTLRRRREDKKVERNSRRPSSIDRYRLKDGESQHKRLNCDAGSNDEHDLVSGERPTGISYGLIRPFGAKEIDMTDLEPDQSQKKEHVGMDKCRKRNNSVRCSRRSIMSAEEREVALRSMQSDGDRRSNYITGAKKSLHVD